MGKLIKKLKSGPVGKAYKIFLKISNRIHKYYILKWRLPREYSKCAKLPVDENKIIFVEIRLPEITNSFKVLFDELVTNYDFTIHSHFLRNTFVSRKEYDRRSIDLVRDMATAKYVFVNEASNVVSAVKMRPETIVTQTWHGCGAFKKFGFSTAQLIFGQTEKEMLKFPFYKNYTHVTLSSPEIAWAYEEAMNLHDRKEVLKAVGTSRTDIFYDENFLAGAVEKLHYFMPASNGKKVILYAPTFRGRVANGKTPNMLNVKMFQQYLGDEYVLLVKHHPLVRKPPVIPAECSEFAQDFTDAMSIEELLAVADICISDYSSLVFEYSLFEKPMIFFSYDLDEYFDWRGFYYNYDELAPGPIFKTNMDMIDYIEHIEERFDKKRVHDFRMKFMSACDGHATERILELVFGDALKTHKRKTPLIGEYNSVPKADELFSDTEAHIKRVAKAKREVTAAYKAALSQPVNEKLVVFMAENGRDEALDGIIGQFKKKGGYELQMVVGTVDNTTEWEPVVAVMAAAKYIFLSGESEVLGLFDIRPETKVVQLWNETFPVMKSGYASKRVSGGLLDDYLKETMLHNEYSLVASASDELGEIYAEAFRYTAPENIKSLGSAATDVLFDRSYRKHAKKKLTEAFPQAKGKKIIFYNPLRRETITRPKRAVFLDCKYMREYLIKDYVLVYSCEMTGRRQPDTIAYIRDFAIDATSALKVSELMACADMMIGDYLPSVFEFACTGRPVMLYAPDRFTYLYGKELNFDYDRIAPGPVFTSVEELTEAILDIDNYDDSRRKNFRDTYLSACDGHAAERIVETIL